MAFERLTIKKIYYYLVCAVALFVLMWGTVDVVSSMFSLTIFRAPSASLDSQPGPQVGSDKSAVEQPMFEEYYQSRMAFDRIGDSLARIIVAGALFWYAGSKVRELEGKEI